MITEILRKAIMIEDTVLRDVLKQLLKREPTPEDAKDIIMFTREDIRDKYLLSYKGDCIGSITKRFSNLKYIVEFDPDEKSFHSRPK